MLTNVRVSQIALLDRPCYLDHPCISFIVEGSNAHLTYILFVTVTILNEIVSSVQTSIDHIQIRPYTLVFCMSIPMHPFKCLKMYNIWRDTFGGLHLKNMA